MKVLLVDDNFQMLEFMDEIISWEELGLEVIGKCETGMDALEIAYNNTPDILITDIDMPKMNGLELIQQMKSLNEHVQSLIISCHDDFQYAQKAVQLFVSDYILKETLVPETFRAAIVKLVDRANKKKQEKEQVESLQMIIDRNRESMKKQWLKDLIVDTNMNEHDWEKRSRLFHLDFDKFDYIPIICRMNQVDKGLRKFKSFESLTFFMSQVAKELISPIRVLEGFSYDFDQIVWLFPHESENGYMAYDAIHTHLIQLQRTVQAYSDVKLSFTYQKSVRTLAELQQSLKELLLQQQIWFYVEEGKVFPFNVRKVEFSKQNIFHHYTDALEEWKKAIIEGNLDNAEVLVNRWVNVLKEQHYHPESVKSWLHNLIVSVELHFNYIFHNDKQHTANLHSEIHSLMNVYQLKRYTKVFFQRMIEFMQSSSNIERLEVWEAKKYVEQHLNERISMETVARQLYMNPSHFSRMFKKETGETFIEYVIRKKMEKAAAYLRETDETIEEIAHQLGYENTSYFIKLFKKRNQISPLEYRKAN